jgi:hypothetical protein
VTAVPEQTGFALAVMLTVGLTVGFTVIVKDWGRPVQLIPPLVSTGVTVMVPVTGELPELIPLKEEISPVPFAARPIEGLLFVQV